MSSSSFDRDDQAQSGMERLVSDHHARWFPPPTYLSNTTDQRPAVQPVAKAFTPRHEPSAPKEGLLTSILVIVILFVAIGGMAWHDCKSAGKPHSHHIR